MAFGNASPPAFDCTDPGAARSCRVINDGVMGGVSTSRLIRAGAALVFAGEVSLDHNGGFASFRGPVRLSPAARALLLTVRGDGKRYRFTLRADDKAGTPHYQAPFVAPREWCTLRFEPGDFAASLRGRPIAAPVVNLAQICYAGVLIADRQAGAFRIELRELRTE